MDDNHSGTNVYFQGSAIIAIYLGGNSFASLLKQEKFERNSNSKTSPIQPTQNGMTLVITIYKNCDLPISPLAL